VGVVFWGLVLVDDKNKYKPRLEEYEENDEDDEFNRLKKEQQNKEVNLAKYQKIVVEEDLEEIVDGKEKKGKNCIFCGEENDPSATRCKKCKQRLF
jgi:ribosomal protein L40E